MELNLSLEIEKIKVEGAESERGLYTSYSACSCVNTVLSDLYEK